MLPDLTLSPPTEREYTGTWGAVVTEFSHYLQCLKRPNNQEATATPWGKFQWICALEENANGPCGAGGECYWAGSRRYRSTAA